MKRLILILALSAAGAGMGAGAGMVLKAPVDDRAEAEDAAHGGEAAHDAGETDHAQSADDAHDAEVAEALAKADAAGEEDETRDPNHDFVRLEKQFVVPVIDEERVASLVVLSIALEVDEGGSDAVFATEPKLRDAFLGVLFTHAQSRGFDGGFTRKDRLEDLRRSLTMAAQGVLGDLAHGVLLTNIVRQDI